eukprot:4777280-Prymnesium_polylepis.1
MRGGTLAAKKKMCSGGLGRKDISACGGTTFHDSNSDAVKTYLDPSIGLRGEVPRYTSCSRSEKAAATRSNCDGSVALNPRRRTAP